MDDYYVTDKMFSEGVSESDSIANTNKLINRVVGDDIINKANNKYLGYVVNMTKDLLAERGSKPAQITWIADEQSRPNIGVDGIDAHICENQMTDDICMIMERTILCFLIYEGRLFFQIYDKEDKTNTVFAFVAKDKTLFTVMKESLEESFEDSLSSSGWKLIAKEYMPHAE